jgi:hypothetical protein
MQLTWNIHIWTVKVFSWWQIPSFLSIGTNRLLARPRLMPPGEKDEEELVDNVVIRNVEVMLDG